jgi:hypothetical protein
MVGSARTGDVVVFMLSPYNATNYTNGFSQYQNFMVGGFNVGTRRLYEVVYNSRSMNVNGTSVSRYIDNNANLSIFGSSASNRRIVNAKLFSAKIYNNDDVVRDFIPVRVGNVGYLYDRVSGQLFGNDGTGGFIVGPDKN